MFLLKDANLIRRLQMACDNHFRSNFIRKNFKAYAIFNMTCMICIYLTCRIGSNSFALFSTPPI
jgi:hypothetical protein